MLRNSTGEAALQALKASSVALGTDIGQSLSSIHIPWLSLLPGGSVRIPAGFCGTYSFKPTHNQLSYRDVANTVNLFINPVQMFTMLISIYHRILVKILIPPPLGLWVHRLTP